MTTFEIIILAIYYLFACTYMCLWCLEGETDREVGDFLLRVFAAATIGIVMFPMVLAGNIWTKLNS